MNSTLQKKILVNLKKLYNKKHGKEKDFQNKQSINELSGDFKMTNMYFLAWRKEKGQKYWKFEKNSQNFSKTDKNLVNTQV